MTFAVRACLLFVLALTGGCGVIFPDTDFEWSIVWWSVGGIVGLAVLIALYSVFFGSSDKDHES